VLLPALVSIRAVNPVVPPAAFPAGKGRFSHQFPYLEHVFYFHLFGVICPVPLEVAPLIKKNQSFY
jgi:hypothetical protein